MITVNIRKKKLKQKKKCVCVLKAIKALDERFATDYVVNISYRKTYSADNNVSAMRGLMYLQAEMKKNHISGIHLIRQMLLEGLLTKRY